MSDRRRASEDDEKLIRLSTGAEILGVSPDAIRKRMAPSGVEELTIVDISKSTAQRRSFRLVYSEVVALRDKLIETARQRNDISRFFMKS